MRFVGWLAIYIAVIALVLVVTAWDFSKITLADVTLLAVTAWSVSWFLFGYDFATTQKKDEELREMWRDIKRLEREKAELEKKIQK